MNLTETIKALFKQNYSQLIAIKDDNAQSAFNRAIAELLLSFSERKEFVRDISCAIIQAEAMQAQVNKFRFYEPVVHATDGDGNIENLAHINDNADIEGLKDILGKS